MADERVDILLGLRTTLEGHTEALNFLKEFAVGLAGVGAALGAAELGAKLGELVTGSQELGKELTIMASRAEISTEAFQNLWLTSSEFGVKQEDLIRGAVTLEKNLAAAEANGASPLNKSLADMNLTAAGLAALAPERRFEVLGERIANATDKHAAFAEALELLGTKTAPKLLEYLKRLGVEGYDKLAESVQNIALTDSQIAALEKAANAWERLWTSVKLIGAHATLLMSPEQAVNPATSSGQIAILQARIAAYEAHGRGDEPAVIQYRQTLAVLQEREQKAAEATEAAKKKAAATNEATMTAASNAAALHAADAEQLKLNVKLGEASQKIFAGLKEITPEQEAEASRVTNQLLDERTKLIEKSLSPMERYQHDLEEIEGQSRLFNLDAETTAKLMGLAAEKFTKASGAVEDWRDAGASAKHVPLRHESKFDARTASFGANVQENLTGERGLLSQIQTPAKNAADTITNTIGGAFKSVQQNVTGLITGTENWHQALANVARTIETDLVSGIVKMFTEWVEQRAVAALASMGWSAAEGEADAAAKAPGAALTSISSFGVAAVVGVAALVAAMASIAKFETGGFTGNDIGLVHPGEFVFSAPAVNSLGLGNLDSLHTAAAGGSAGGGSFGGSSRPQQVIHRIAESPSHAKQMFEDPNFDSHMLTWTRRHLGLG